MVTLACDDKTPDAFVDVLSAPGTFPSAMDYPSIMFPGHYVCLRHTPNQLYLYCVLIEW